MMMIQMKFAMEDLVLQPKNNMDFIKKHREKFQVGLIVLLLAIALGIGTPLVIRNIKEAQIQAEKLESKANAKEAWQKEFDAGNIEQDEIFEWDDGTYYWIIDSKGNITSK